MANLFQLPDYSSLNPLGSAITPNPMQGTPAPYAIPKPQADAQVMRTVLNKKNVNSSAIPTASAAEGLSDDEIRTLISEGYSNEEINAANEELLKAPAQPQEKPEPSFGESVRKSMEERIGSVNK